MDADHTLNSPDVARWRIVAAESGMPMEEIEAVARVRHRALAAASLCQEAIPGAGPAGVVAVFEAMGEEVSASVEWPEG